MNRTIANLISRAESRTHTASRPGLYTRFFFYLLISTLIVELIIQFAIQGHALILFKEDRIVEWL